MSGHWHCWCVCTLQQALNVYRRSLPLFFILNSTSGCVSVCLNRQQQVCACVCTRVRVFVRGKIHPPTRNPRATDAPACQINSHNSPRTATNVNLRKGESVQSLSAAIFTRILCTCSVGIKRQTEKKRKKRQTGVKNLRELRNLARLPPCSHCLSV